MNNQRRFPFKSKYPIPLALCLLIGSSVHYSAQAVDECTTFVGMSQTRDTCDGLDRIGATNFVCLWKGNQEIDDFTRDAAYRGLRVRHNNCAGANPYDSPRVAIQLSAPKRSLSDVYHFADEVLDKVRKWFLKARYVILISSTGGPSGDWCPVRDDMRNHKSCVMVDGDCLVRSSYQYSTQNWQGLFDYAAENEGVEAYASEVCMCENYSDGKGHFRGSGDRCVGTKWRDDILAVEVLTGPDSLPEQDPEPTEGPQTRAEAYQLCKTKVLGGGKPRNRAERRILKTCIKGYGF